MSHPVRLPLQVGTTSLWSVARAAATLVPSLVLLLGAVLALMEKVGGIALFGGVLGVYFLVYSVAHIVRAWRTRASDAVLGSAKLSFQGGAQHGLELDWTAIDGDKTEAQTVDEARLTMKKIFGDFFFLAMSSLLSNKLELAPEDKVPVRRLELHARDGRSWMLAEAEHPAEQRSLDALLGSIQAKLGPPKRRDAKSSQQVLCCQSCGAPQKPTDAAAVTCPYCQATTPIPEDVRQRVAAHRTVAQAQQTMVTVVEKLLHQPGAQRASVVLVILTILAALLWVPLVGSLFLIGITNAGVFEVGWALVAGVMGVLAFFILARAALARRRALRLLTSGFGARAPSDEQSGYACRRCGGPLPESQQLVARCGYCDADNILGVDLRSEVAPTKEHELSLAEALEAQKRERRGWLLASVGAFVIMAIFAIMVAASVSMSLEHTEQIRRCEAEDAEACLDVARDFSLGISVAENDEKAIEYEEKACELGNGEACNDLSTRYQYGWGVMELIEEAQKYRDRSCKLGFAEACKAPE
jgi:hypothetical protein